jgi:chlorite dismutase
MPNIEYGDYVKFSFFKARTSWRLLEPNRRAQLREELASALECVGEATGFPISSFSTVGTRADADLLLFQSAPSVETFHETAAAINRTEASAHLDQPHSYLSIRRKTRYRHGGGNPAVERKDKRYFIVYPMTKTRSWYGLSMEERQQMMNDHFRIGHGYPGVTINTTYSFGIDDPEFVVAFETDDPSEFVSLVMDLREVPGAQYTASETPIFTTIRMSLEDSLQAIG